MQAPYESCSTLSLEERGDLISGLSPPDLYRQVLQFAGVWG
jgi:hypothetical protein